MSKSLEALTALVTQWKQLKTIFPNDGDFVQYGHPGLGYAAIDRILDNWDRTITSLDEKNAWITVPELAVADVGLSIYLQDIYAQVSAASSNGVQWLLTSGHFMQKMADAQSFITGLAVRRFSIARELAKFLADKGEVEIERLIAAEAAATEVVEASKTIAASAEKATQSLGEISGYETQASTAKASAEQYSADAGSAANAAERSKADAAIDQAEVLRLKNDAIQREADLARRVSELNESINATNAEANKARENVAKALRDVKSQGLASSFEKRSRKLNVERWLWTSVFVVAVVALAIISIVLVAELPDFTYQTLVVAALRRVATAAPFVWLGWYAAKQISRVSKIQEDYEYKAASALAYQAYKDEALSGDPELHKKLLDHAIETFGENPVRLQQDVHLEPHTPLEDLLKHAKPEKLADLLASALSKHLNK